MNEMEQYAERAIEIINELYTERLDYESEYAPLIDAAHTLKKYEGIGTVEEFAAYKQAVDFSKAKAKELKERIDARSAANYHDESKRVLIFEERRMAYLDVVEAAEAALAAKEGERE